jgi:two-component system, chemotaxis family, sensor kinase Cph1
MILLSFTSIFTLPFIIIAIMFLLSIALFLVILKNYKNAFKIKGIDIIKRENLYRTLFDNTGNCIILIDKDFRILLSNNEFEKLSGFSRDEIDNKLNFKDLVHISDSKKLFNFSNSVLSANSKSENQTDLKILIKSGEEKYCISKFTPIRGSNQYIVSLTDITKNKSDEKMLIDSHEQYKAILNAIPNLIFHIDENGRILGSQKFKDKDISFFITLPNKAVFIQELFPAEIAEEILWQKDVTINTKKTTQFEFTIFSNERLLFFEAQIIPIGANQSLFVMQNITERIEKDKTIKILGHAVKEVSECVNITDENNIIQFVNKAFLSTYGYKEEEVIGKSVNMIVAENNPEDLLDEIKEARLKGSWHGEIFNVNKKGVEFPVYLSTSLIKDDESKTIAIFAVSIDISERIKQTNNIKRLNNELVDKNKELEQIVYIASHDLRSPLINIEGFSYELSKMSKSIIDSLSADQKDKLKDFDNIYGYLFEEMPSCLEYIQASTKKMDALIAGLLKISRLGKDPLNIDLINMNELIENVVKNFSFQINQKKAKIIFKELPRCNADIVLLNQVFSNLISNSLKYSDSGIIPIIEIGGESFKDKVVYFIKDNGIGIPENKQEDIFKLFYRLSNDNTGDGLGLSIVKKIMDKHNGRVWVANNEEKGCSFMIELPSLLS